MHYDPTSRPDQAAPLLVNLGCGDRHHPAWINFDKNAAHPDVVRHDVMAPLPLPDACAAAVYSSHLLEHLPRDLAPGLLGECFRVLRPGGLVRLAVPDLEAAARSYLRQLDGALADDPAAKERYAWAVVELIDQLCRHVPGGEVVRYWRRDPMPAEAFVLERTGSEAKNAIARLRAQPGEAPPAMELDPARLGHFRLAGECHLWMYDRYSLAELLRGAGFVAIRRCRADESAIADFNRYLLDIEADGATRKPDSLFMEAAKPGRPDADGPRP